MNQEGCRIFVWGKLADIDVGDRKEVEVKVPTEISDQFDDNRIIQVASGSRHFVALTNIGCVYTWGCNSFGQLGHGDLIDRSRPEAIRSISLFTVVQNQKFVKLGCGNTHTVGLTDDGRVYSWGYSSHGQLGTGEFEFQLHPQLIIPLCKYRIIDISCGGSHTVCIDDEGTVFSWGKGDGGRLGIGTCEHTPTPSPVISLKGIKIVQVACGSCHTLALSEDGVVFTWGQDRDGSLGIGNVEYIVVPFVINYFVKNNIKISTINAGYFHSAAISTDGALYTWGWGEHGQLGHGNYKSEKYPKLVVAFKDKTTTMIYCGSFHCLSITDGILWAWGEGDQYCLGNGENVSATEPIIVKSLENYSVLSMSCGLTHSIAVVGGAEQRQSILINNAKINHDIKIIKKKLKNSQNSDPINIKKKSKRQTFNRLTLTNSQHSIDAEKQYWTEKILPNLESIQKSKKIVKLLRSGIPPSIRGYVWSHAIPNKLNITREIFDEVSRIAERKKLENSEDGSFAVIEQDIPRTLSKTGQFGRKGPYRKYLEKLLQCYDCYIPEVGYVQGMSYLGAILILHMDTFEAFKCLANTLNDHFFKSLFKMDLIQIYRHMKIYEILFQNNFPELFKHFDNLNISPEHYLLDWFMTLFGRLLKLEICSHIFDCYTLEGEVFLYKTALGYIKCNAKKLLESNFEECLAMLRSNQIEESELFKAIESISVPDDIKDYIAEIELQEQKEKCI